MPFVQCVRSCSNALCKLEKLKVSAEFLVVEHFEAPTAE